MIWKDQNDFRACLICIFPCVASADAAVEKKDFLLDFLQFLFTKQMLNAPVSLEKCGLLLFDYASQTVPEYQANVAFSWITAGLPQSKLPCKVLIPYFDEIPENIKIIKGN